MNYTSIEQSKKLLELGLSPESADMYYDKDIQAFPFITPYQNGKYPPFYWKQYPNLRNRIPCWSIGALLKLISNYSLRKMGSKYWITFYNAPKISPTPTHVIDDCNNEIEAVYEMVVWLLENGYIKKIE